MFSPQFFAGTLGSNTMGPPNPATDLIQRIVLFTFPHHVAWNAIFAAIQLGVGAGLLWRRTRKVALAVSIGWALGVWFVGEGLGNLIFPQASMLTGAPGAGLLMALAAVLVWPRGDQGATAAGKGLIRSTSAAGGGLIGDAGARAAWWALWVGSAALELERSNNAPDAIAAQVRALAGGPIQIPGQAATGGPEALLSAMDHLAGTALNGHGTLAALVMAVVQVWVGMAILRPATRKAALGVGMAVSALYWVLGQNFGGIFSGQASDAGTGIVVVLIALALWPKVLASQANLSARAVPITEITASPGPELMPQAASTSQVRHRPDRHQRGAQARPVAEAR